MRVLISGTTGWLGGELARIIASDHQVTGLGRRPTTIEKVTSVQADLSQEGAQKTITEAGPFDVAVHLAGVLGTCTFQDGMEANVNGTRRFVKAAIATGCKKIIVASTVAAIGTVAPMTPPSKLPMPADHPFEGGQWPYAFSKHTVEQMLKFMSGEPECEEIDFILVRVGAVVTDPPEIVHKDGMKDGKMVQWRVDPADCTASPYTKENSMIFPEAPLCSIALSDQVGCLKAAVESRHKAGVRTVVCVSPKLYANQTVPALMRSWYGEQAASKIDMSYYDTPGRERDPIFDLSAAWNEIGWKPTVDLLQGAEPVLSNASGAATASGPSAVSAGDATVALSEGEEVQVIVVKEVSAEAQAEWLRMADELAQATWKEDGCLLYKFVKGDGDTYIIMERWASQAHLDAHFATPHFTKLVPLMDGISKTASLNVCKSALSTARPPRTSKILVLFDSASTCTEQMAELVAEGARQLDHVEVRLRAVPGADNHWDCKGARLKHQPADFHDLLWADGVAAGSPTNLGCVSWRMKKFWDDFSQAGYWAKVDGKVGCAFSSVGGNAGGAEIVNMALNAIMMNFGFSCFGVTDYVDFKHTLHYGASVAKAPRADVDKMVCRRLGRRLAEFVGFYISHRPDVHPLLSSKAKDFERWDGPIPPRDAPREELVRMNELKHQGPVAYPELSDAFLANLPALPQSARPSSAAPKALVYTLMKEFQHSCTAAATGFVVSVLEEAGWTTVVSDDPKDLEVGTASDVGLIVLVNNSGQIFDPTKEALTAHLEAGRPVVGIHAALATFLDGQDAAGATPLKATSNLITDVFGTHFVNHPPPQDGRVELSTGLSGEWQQLLAEVPASFSVHDEFYNFTSNPAAAEGVEVLASVDVKSIEGSTMGAQHPLVWCREYGKNKARVFYCSLGHFSAQYRRGTDKIDPVGGIIAAGLKYATARPNK